MDLHELRDRLDCLENRGAAAADLERLFAEEYTISARPTAPAKRDEAARADGEARPRARAARAPRTHPLSA